MLTEFDRRNFARYIIRTVVEDGTDLMDVIELYDSWYDEDQHAPDITEKDAGKVLDLVLSASIRATWPDGE